MRVFVAVALLGIAGAQGQTRPQGATASAPADVRLGPLPDTNTDFKPAHFASLNEWKKRRDWLRMQVRVAAGLWPEPEKCPLNARVFGKIEGDGYTIEKVHFESYPGLYVTGNLYRHARPPRGAAATEAKSQKSPGVLCPHGHWKSGRLEQTEVGNIPARCIMLARMGCTVLAYDMVGYNDSSRQFEHRKINTPALDLWGITSMHLQTWNSVRAIDFLQSLPEVDPERIGVTGASGGGTQTFMIAAVDDRVKVGCPVNMISHTMQGGCSCENAPCLRIDTNNMEIGALFAPKPMLMVSATGDWTKDTPTVEYPFIKSLYALYGQPDSVENAHFDAPHNYNQQSREAMYRFFARHLLGWPEDKANAVKESDIPAYKPEELLVWDEQEQPSEEVSPDRLYREIKRKVGRWARIPDLMTASHYQELASGVRAGLTHLIGSDLPIIDDRPRIDGEPDPLRLERDLNTYILEQTYERYGRLVTVWRSGVWDSKPSRLTIYVTPTAVTDRAQLQVPALAELHLGWHTGVFLKPVTSMSSTQRTSEPTKRLHFHSTFNRSDVAEEGFDVLTVTGAKLHNKFVGRMSLIGVGRAGAVALLARAVIPQRLAEQKDLRTIIDMNRFDTDSDEAYLKELNIPHIRRIGGLRAIAAAACNGPIWFHNVGDHFDEAFVKAAGRVNGVEVRVTREKASDKEIAEWLIEPQ